MKTNVFFLLKFGRQQDIENLFYKGEIFMNTIKWFKDFEKKDVGDKYEGALKIKNLKRGKLTLELPSGPITLDAKNVQMSNNLEGHIGNIYSIYAISDELVKRKWQHRIDNRMENFGTHCLFIKNPKLFLSKLKYKLTDLGHEYSSGLVTYKNYSINNHELTPFNKSHILGYQKEHRTIAWTNKTEALKFEIGSLEDISKIYETKTLIKNLILKKETVPNTK